MWLRLAEAGETAARIAAIATKSTTLMTILSAPAARAGLHHTTRTYAPRVLFKTACGNLSGRCRFGTLSAYGSEGDDAQRSRGDARACRRAHGDEGGPGRPCRVPQPLTILSVATKMYWLHFRW